MTGTVIAQAISIAMAPILTRLYTPEAFGLFGVFLALVSSISPCVTGRYEVAMVLPKWNNVAIELFAVGIWVGFAVSTLCFLFFLLFQERLLHLLKAPDLESWLLLAPVVLLAIGLFNLGGYFANRHKQYGLMARSRIIKSIAVIALNVILGVAGAGFQGLLIGNLVGWVVAFLYLVYKQRFVLARVRMKWTKRKLSLARRYADYPIYNASPALLNGITLALPIFFVTSNFSVAIAGYYALVTQVMNAPLAFISYSVSQVNLKKVVDLANDGKRVDLYIYKVTLILILLSLPPAIVLVFWGPELFSFVFGKDWLEAGRYARILALAVAIQFIASTLSSTIGATNNNRYGALWKITALVLTAVVLGIISRNGNIEEMLGALVINNIALYLFYYYLIVKSSRNPRNQNNVWNRRNS